MEAYNNLTQAKKHALREQRKTDGKAVFYIHEAMHESILPRVEKKLMLSIHGTHWILPIKVWLR